MGWTVNKSILTTLRRADPKTRFIAKDIGNIIQSNRSDGITGY
jgi:hypothetical protein